MTIYYQPEEIVPGVIVVNKERGIEYLLVGEIVSLTVERMHQGNKLYQCEVRATLKNGTTHWLACSSDEESALTIANKYILMSNYINNTDY